MDWKKDWDAGKKVRMSGVKAGDVIVTDEGFTCTKPGRKKLQVDAGGDLFFWCAGTVELKKDGTRRKKDLHKRERHYLTGQIERGGWLTGLRLVTP